MNQILNECCEQRKPVAQTTNVASFDSFAKLLVLARVAMNWKKNKTVFINTTQNEVNTI